jgi:hypothetical protein
MKSRTELMRELRLKVEEDIADVLNSIRHISEWLAMPDLTNEERTEYENILPQYRELLASYERIRETWED